MENLEMAKMAKPKNGVGIITQTRLSRPERAALDKAAAADRRPTASLMRKILVDWLIENEWLK